MGTGGGGTEAGAGAGAGAGAEAQGFAPPNALRRASLGSCAVDPLPKFPKTSHHYYYHYYYKVDKQDIHML